MNMVRKFKPGDKVITSGYKGIVLGYYSTRMIEVRLDTGVCCIDENDATLEVTNDNR